MDKVSVGATVYFSIDARAADGRLQLSIGLENERGGGHGYRIAGPKYNGSGKQLLKHVLSERDIKEIRQYLNLARAALAGRGGS